jgi:hypothetical protein
MDKSVLVAALREIKKKVWFDAKSVGFCSVHGVMGSGDTGNDSDKTRMVRFG